MRDPVVGGFSKEKIALRRAIAMAHDVDEEIRLVLGEAQRLTFRFRPAWRPRSRLPAAAALRSVLANQLLDHGYRRAPMAGAPCRMASRWSSLHLAQ
jgi:hypothetical protein